LVLLPIAGSIDAPDVVADVVFDGAVDVSATLSLTSLSVARSGRRSQLRLRRANRSKDQDGSGRVVDVNDKGGAHVHGAVKDYVCAHVDRREHWNEPPGCGTSD
jgi:hypothetical protein